MSGREGTWLDHVGGSNRDLIERHVERVIIKPQALEVRLVPTSEASALTEESGTKDLGASQLPMPAITLAWTAPSFAAVKGIVHAPSARPELKPESRDALLTAIAKARSWIDDIRLGRIASFAEIAKRECQGERHVRLLTPLAFVLPRIIAAIVPPNGGIKRVTLGVPSTVLTCNHLCLSLQVSPPYTC
jgi:site-specific DNA recombinase